MRIPEIKHCFRLNSKTCKLRGLVVCIIDHYPLRNQRIEYREDSILVKNLGVYQYVSRCLNPDFLILHLAALPLCYFVVTVETRDACWAAELEYPQHGYQRQK